MRYFKLSLRKGDGGQGALASFIAKSGSASSFHHVVWSTQSNRGGDRDGLLHRVVRDGGGRMQYLIVQSREALLDPTRGGFDIAECSHIGALVASLRVDQRVAWTLRVNATIKIGKQKHSIVEHARIHDRDEGEPLITTAQRVVAPWVQSRLAAIGLDTNLGDIRVDAHCKRQVLRDIDSRSIITIAETDVVGMGRVTDPEALRQGIMRGVGGAGAYGCGLLLLR